MISFTGIVQTYVQQYTRMYVRAQYHVSATTRNIKKPVKGTSKYFNMSSTYYKDAVLLS